MATEKPTKTSVKPLDQAKKKPARQPGAKTAKGRTAAFSADNESTLFAGKAKNAAGAATKTPKVRAPRKPPTPRKFQKPVHPKAKMTFRRNVVPPILGILLTAGLLGLLNAQWLIAQAQYRFMKPVSATNVSIEPTVTNPDARPQLFIPKLNLTAPIITSERSYDQAKVQLALQKGVVQYGASADPGQVGNLVVIGHSSGQLWAPGDYKFVFTLLDKLANDDRIFIDFKGKRFIYRVTTMKIVPPTDLSVLQPTGEPRLTLITCTPVGTSKDRLIIIARQVSPDPTTATPIDPSRVRPVTTQVIPN